MIEKLFTKKFIAKLSFVESLGSLEQFIKLLKVFPHIEIIKIDTYFDLDKLNVAIGLCKNLYALYLKHPVYEEFVQGVISTFSNYSNLRKLKLQVFTKSELVQPLCCQFIPSAATTLEELKIEFLSIEDKYSNEKMTENHDTLLLNSLGFLFSGLIQNNSIKKISIACDFSTNLVPISMSPQILSLFQQVVQKSYEEIKILNINLKEEEMNGLIAGIESNPKLTALSLIACFDNEPDNKIEENIERLFTTLQKKELEKLAITFSWPKTLQKNAIKKIVQMIQSVPSLKKINLSGLITRPQFHELTELIITNPNLIKIKVIPPPLGEHNTNLDDKDEKEFIINVSKLLRALPEGRINFIKIDVFTHYFKHGKDNQIKTIAKNFKTIFNANKINLNPNFSLTEKSRYITHLGLQVTPPPLFNITSFFIKNNNDVKKAFEQTELPIEIKDNFNKVLRNRFSLQVRQTPEEESLDAPMTKAQKFL